MPQPKCIDAYLTGSIHFGFRSTPILKFQNELDITKSFVLFIDQLLNINTNMLYNAPGQFSQYSDKPCVGRSVFYFWLDQKISQSHPAVLGIPIQRQSGWKAKLNIYIHLDQRLRMRGATPPLLISPDGVVSNSTLRQLFLFPLLHQGFLKYICATELSEGLVKPTDPFSKIKRHLNA